MQAGRRASVELLLRSRPAESEGNLLLMRLIDEQHMRHPQFGYPRMTDWLAEQGSQFTSQAFTRALLDKGIVISMDGRGRALDNVFIERLW